MNPFAAFAESADEDDFVQTPTQTKPPKKTHQERKAIKAQKIQEAEKNARPVATVNESLPEHVKDNQRNKRYHEVIPPKEVPAKGHYLDRRSGTGRDDRPRKEGGGRGNVGNLQDELKKDKYTKEGEQAVEETEAQEPQPEEPQGITLEEYYRQKGIEVPQVQQREAVKKGEIKADWIAKEKLTVLETKEDKRERQQAQHSRRDLKNQVGLDTANAELLGFGISRPQPRREREEEAPREQRGPREQKGGRDNKPADTRKAAPKRQEKVVLKDDDFPSL